MACSHEESARQFLTEDELITAVSNTITICIALNARLLQLPSKNR